MPFCLRELGTARGLGKAVGARCEWTWPKVQRGLGWCMVALVPLHTFPMPSAFFLDVWLEHPWSVGLSHCHRGKSP